MKWLILVSGILCNAAASVLIKLALMPPRRFPTFEEPWQALRNWPFWLGLSFYAATFLLYAIALSRLPLNVVHPVMTAGAIAAVAVCSASLLGESFGWTTVMGLLLVGVGVVLITAQVAG